MNEYLMFALALSPLLLMVLLILKLKMPIHFSVLISLVFTAILAIIFWKMPIINLTSAVSYGAIKGLWPIVIVILGAIFSYNVMQATKALDTLREILASISEDKRIQVLLISWCFGGFLEAAAGYGTAVAIPIGILIALGFDPLKSAIASLVANTVPTAFGAVGIPVAILAEQVNLSVYTLGGTIILQLAVFNILLPFLIIAIIGGGIKAIRGVFFITLLCGITTLIPQYLVAVHLGAELPAFAGSLVSLLAVIIACKLRKGEIEPQWKIQGNNHRTPTQISARVLLRVGSIYLLILIFILLCSPLFPSIKSSASQLTSAFNFPLTNSKDLTLKIEWITTPGMLIIFATIIGGFIQGASAKMMADVFVKTAIQLKNSIIAIMAIVAMATVMDISGIISTLAQSIVDLTGTSYVFLAPVIGALGTFVTGSDTNSNILFGKLQTIAANKLHIDPYWLASANTAGATGGKMISPQSIAIAVSATKMDGQATQIMSGTMKYCCAYIGILGLKVGLLYFLYMR